MANFFLDDFVVVRHSGCVGRVVDISYSDIHTVRFFPIFGGREDREYSRGSLKAASPNEIDFFTKAEAKVLGQGANTGVKKVSGRATPDKPDKTPKVSIESTFALKVNDFEVSVVVPDYYDNDAEIRFTASCGDELILTLEQLEQLYSWASEINDDEAFVEALRLIVDKVQSL